MEKVRLQKRIAMAGQGMFYCWLCIRPPPDTTRLWFFRQNIKRVINLWFFKSRSQPSVSSTKWNAGNQIGDRTPSKNEYSRNYCRWGKKSGGPIPLTKKKRWGYSGTFLLSTIPVRRTFSPIDLRTPELPAPLAEPPPWGQRNCDRVVMVGHGWGMKTQNEKKRGPIKTRVP